MSNTSEILISKKQIGPGKYEETYHYYKDNKKYEKKVIKVLKVVLERANWKPFGQGHSPPMLCDETFIEWNKDYLRKYVDKNLEEKLLNLEKPKDFSEVIEIATDEYVPPGNYTIEPTIIQEKESDTYQLPDLFKVSIDKRITVIVRNIETHFDEFELKGILYDLASENGEVKDIKIPKSKKFFDYQLKKEVLQPRIAFITYPHEADAHYSIEYLNGQRLGNSIITAELCEEKKTW